MTSKPLLKFVVDTKSVVVQVQYCVGRKQEETVLFAEVAGILVGTAVRRGFSCKRGLASLLRLIVLDHSPHSAATGL